MADVVRIKKLKIETVIVKLTKALLKQFEFTDELTNPDVYSLLRPNTGEKFNPNVVGWVHGSVLEAGEDYWHWVIVAKGDGTYLRVRATAAAVKKYAPRQLYIV